MSELKQIHIKYIRSGLTFRLIIAIIISAVLVSCQNNETIVNQVITKDRLTETKLDSVLEYYTLQSDTLGVLATKFIARNIDNKFTIDDENGTIISDIKKLTSREIIRNIDKALLVSRSEILNNLLPFNDFLEYVLPYRTGNEKMVDWRTDCLLRYESIYSERKKFKLLENYHQYTIETINNQLKGTFRFDTNISPANLKNWNELISEKTGDCLSMASTIIYPLRALGVPVSIDFITSWANSNGGEHSWNVLIDKKERPFLGFESSPPKYDPFGVYDQIRRFPAKIFRKTFSKNANLLHYIKTKNDFVPTSLDFEDAIDVTNHYFETSNISLKLIDKIKPRISYLSIFKNGELEPVFWAINYGSKYQFNNMTNEILYVPTSYEDNNMRPLYFPFSVKKSHLKVYKPDTVSTININIKEIRSKQQDALAQYGKTIAYEQFVVIMDSISKGKSLSRPVDGELYTLYYWSNRWIQIRGQIKIVDTDLNFKGIPSNAIYKIVGKESGDWRIFSYERGNQIWW